MNFAESKHFGKPESPQIKHALVLNHLSSEAREQ